MSELQHLTIAEAAKLIQARKLSPVELTQACLRRTCSRWTHALRATTGWTEEPADVYRPPVGA